MTTLALGSIQARPLPLNWRRISALSGSFSAHIALVLLLLIPPVALELKRVVVHNEQPMTWVIHPEPVVTDEPPIPVPIHPVKQKVTLPQLQKPVITMEAPTRLDVPVSNDVPVDAGNHAATGQASGAADIGGDAAPTALTYGSRTTIPYPRVAVLNREQGTVMLKVFVGVDGRPQQVEIEHSSGSRALDVAARDAVKRWTFKPGMRGGAAYAAWALVPVTFTLP
jgi:protein TonB